MDKLYSEYTFRIIQFIINHQLKLKEKQTDPDTYDLIGGVESLLHDFTDQLEQLGRSKHTKFIDDSHKSMRMLLKGPKQEK